MCAFGDPTHKCFFTDRTFEVFDIYSPIAKRFNSTRSSLKLNKSYLYVVVNKVDNRRLEEESFDLYRLGVEKLFPISSIEIFKGIKLRVI